MDKNDNIVMISKDIRANERYIRERLADCGDIQIRKMRLGEDAFFPIIKNTQTYRIVRMKDRIDNILCRYIHTTSSISSVKYRIGICLRFAHRISCSIPSEMLLPNTHSWTHFVRST